MLCKQLNFILSKQIQREINALIYLFFATSVIEPALVVYNLIRVRFDPITLNATIILKLMIIDVKY